MKLLSDLNPGEAGTVVEINADNTLRRRIIDMGITLGTKIQIVKSAPLGDPMQIRVRGYEMIIRKSEMAKIVVSSESEET